MRVCVCQTEKARENKGEKRKARRKEEGKGEKGKIRRERKKDKRE